MAPPTEIANKAEYHRVEGVRFADPGFQKTREIFASPEGSTRLHPSRAQASFEQRTLIMKIVSATCLAVIALLVPIHPSVAAGPGYKVVVNQANVTSSITSQQLSRIFLKQTNSWIDGTTTQPIDQVSTSEVRKAFSKEVLGRDVNAVKSHWQRQIFSGRGVPPPEKNTDAEVLDFVEANPGAVGYVALTTVLSERVRELEVSVK